MRSHIDHVGNVPFVEEKKCHDKIVHQRQLAKKNQFLFELLAKDMKISDILYKIQKIQGTPWALQHYHQP